MRLRPITVGVLCLLAASATGRELRSAGPAPAGGTFAGTVTAVLSADTLVVRSGGRDWPIRLLGVDAPEAGEAFGVLARTRAAELALTHRVTVFILREDPRGRTVGAVRLPDGRDLGYELVAAGLARWDRQSAPDARGLERAEAEARSAGRGLWRGAAAAAPGRP